MARLVLVHTVRAVAQTFDQLAREILGDAFDIVHVVDEILLRELLDNKRITAFIHRHFAQHVVEAEESGADAVLLTCSSLAPCASAVHTLVGIPVFRVDRAMAEKALTIGPRIGILATSELPLDPLYSLVRELADEMSLPIAVEPVVCPPQAYQAMLAGDMATHDKMVREELASLASRADVVMLAQGSMVSALSGIAPETMRVPVLTSPRLALEQVRDEWNSGAME